MLAHGPRVMTRNKRYEVTLIVLEQEEGRIGLGFFGMCSGMILSRGQKVRYERRDKCVSVPWLFIGSGTGCSH